MAALVVAGITVYISVLLGKRTVDALVDAAPKGTAERIATAISRVPGVLRHQRIRVRQSGQNLFVDLRLLLESNISFEHAQSVVSGVESSVKEIFPNADVVIHAAPTEPASSDVIERVRSIAHRNNFLVHDVTAFEVNGRVNVSLDLELDPSLRLEAAHRQATRLEGEILSQLPEVGEVNVHIEPLLERVETANEARLVRSNMERELLKIARGTPELVDVHSVEAHQVGDKVLVSLHCTLEPDRPLAQVHHITEDLEFRFRRAFPQIFKVSIHAEPRGQ